MKQNSTLAVILNGPPMSGKDVTAQGIIEAFEEKNKESDNPINVVLESFKNALYEETEAYLRDVLRYTEERSKEIVELSKDRVKKDEPLDEGKTPREFLIECSEEYVKPNKGKSYFGDVLADKLLSYGENTVAVIPDGGFNEEIKVFHDKGIPTIVLRLYRDGCTFDGDSRHYINGLYTYGIRNNGELKNAVGKALTCIGLAANDLANAFTEELEKQNEEE